MRKLLNGFVGVLHPAKLAVNMKVSIETYYVADCISTVEIMLKITAKSLLGNSNSILIMNTVGEVKQSLIKADDLRVEIYRILVKSYSFYSLPQEVFLKQTNTFP